MALLVAARGGGRAAARWPSGWPALAALLAVARRRGRRASRRWKPALAADASATPRSCSPSTARSSGEKRRLSRDPGRARPAAHGIDQLEDEGERGAVRPRTPAHALQQVSEEGRRARQLDRAAELGRGPARARGGGAGGPPRPRRPLLRRRPRAREAYLRAARRPRDASSRTASCPSSDDPFAFVLERGSAFYATDFKRLLWTLPYYHGEVKVGSLLAVPVRTGDVVAGVLVADRLEMQSLTGDEPELLEAFAEPRRRRDPAGAGRALAARSWTSSSRPSTRSRRGSPRSPASPRCGTSCCAPRATSSPWRGRRWSMTDELQTRYMVEERHGWTAEFAEARGGARGEDVGGLGPAERGGRLPARRRGRRTRSACPSSCSTRARAGRSRSSPCPCARATARWARSSSRAARGSFDAASQRVLAILANQAAATLSLIRDKERQKELAVRDGLTGLYNRRAFDELLVQAVAREDRQGGRFALLLLDLDHFKKLNDTYGHPAGDAALARRREVLDAAPAQGRPGRALRGRGVRGDPARHRRGGRPAPGRARARGGRRRTASSSRAHASIVTASLGARGVARRTARSRRPSWPPPTARSTRPSRPAATAWSPPRRCRARLPRSPTVRTELSVRTFELGPDGAGFFIR